MRSLLSPCVIEGLSIRNRVGLSPMCTYCAQDGQPSDWHLVHLGARALGGVGLVCVEATAIESRGRVTPYDLVLASAASVPAFARLARFLREQGATAAIQLSHAGRKACRSRPWEGDLPIDVDAGGWEIVAPSPIAFGAGYATPVELSRSDIHAIIEQFAASARYAVDAGFQLVELHAGHGRLLHSFCSPISNHRTDAYGGSFQNRIRMLLECVEAVHASLRRQALLAVRLSVIDWAPDGWSLDDSIELAAILKGAGVALIDCSSGGIVRPLRVSTAPGYQVPFAAAIRQRVGIATAAVGRITDCAQANAIIAREDADMVLLGRALLANPHWLLRMSEAPGSPAHALVPPQYMKAAQSLASYQLEHIPEL